MIFRLFLFDISADGGKTYTTQWLTNNEAEEIKKEFPHYIIIKRDPGQFYKEIYA